MHEIMKYHVSKGRIHSIVPSNETQMVYGDIINTMNYIYECILYEGSISTSYQASSMKGQ